MRHVLAVQSHSPCHTHGLVDYWIGLFTFVSLQRRGETIWKVSLPEINLYITLKRATVELYMMLNSIFWQRKRVPSTP